MSKTLELTPLQKSVLEGCLLGDGSLVLHKGCRNVYFTYSSSSIQHTEFVHKYFKDFCSDTYKNVRCRRVFDKRTNKTYTTYTFRTYVLEHLTNIYHKWYPNGRKEIPMGFSLNPTIYLFWYIGDGELESTYNHIKLHTNCFQKKHLEDLILQMVQFKARVTYKEGNQYIITIPRRYAKCFLDFIGECPFDDYSYKWNLIPYKNKKYEFGQVNNYSELYPRIIEEYLSTLKSIHTLSKEFNVPIKCIKNHFNKIKLPIRNDGVIPKSLFQYDKEGILIKQWRSAWEAHKKLGYNASYLYRISKLGNVMYKDCYWSFKKF